MLTIQDSSFISKKLIGLNKYFDEMVSLYEKNLFPNVFLLSGKKGIGKFTLAFHFVNYVYSKQEENSLRLIYSEIFIALNIQKKGGIFICKIFDTFLEKTINLLTLLNISYEKVYIHKPKISRNSNSEKYIVCIGYKGYNKLIINKMSHGFRDSNIGLVSIDSYYDCIIHYIIEYTINQIKSINKGIDLIINKNITKNPTLFQINEAIDWCNKYKIPINKHCMYLK